jgi:small-conductance mechanosensitive channel
MRYFLEHQMTNFWPAVALAGGFPLVMLLLNEVIGRCERSQRPMVGSLRVLRNLVAPSLALCIFLRFVAELPQQSTFARVVETGFYLSFLFALLGIVSDIAFRQGNGEAGQQRVPKLFTDLVRAGVVAIGAMVIYSSVWGREIKGALTALGVGSVVIGLALQEPLGNLVSGLMLLLERPLKVGDWVAADGVMGKVIEINWRSVHIQTGGRELRIVPNVTLYKGAFSNLSRPDDIRTESLQLSFSYDDAPNRVKDVLLSVLRSTSGVLADPAPAVRTLDYADYSITYRVTFSVARQEDLAATRDRVMTRLWYVVRREGLTIPFPIQMEYGPGESPGVAPRSAPEWLVQYPEFRAAVGDSAEKQPKIVEFAAGESIQREGTRFAGFALMLRGKAKLFAARPNGSVLEVGEIGPGECFGDQVTTGAVADELEIVATEDVTIIVFASAAIHELLNRSPTLAAQIGDAIEARRQASQSVRRRRVANN